MKTVRPDGFSYGTIEASDRENSDTEKMICYKFLFYNCCSCVRNKKSSLRSVNRKRLSTDAETEGCVHFSALEASQEAEGDTVDLNPDESIHALAGGKELISSTPRLRSHRDESNNESGKQDTSSVPLISVLDCTEDVSENPSIKSSEKDEIDQIDADEEKEDVLVFGNQSQTSLSSVKEGTENGIKKAENGENTQVSQDSEVDHLPAYHSRSQLSVSTEFVQDASMADINSASHEDDHYDNIKVSGDILFGVNYDYKNECLEVHVKECRNLSPVDAKKNRSDPYVKAYLLPDRSKTSKRKTKVKKHSLNPVFDEKLKFPIKISELERRILWLSVWHSQWGRNDFLGEMMLPLTRETIENYGYKMQPLKERVGRNDSLLAYSGDIELGLKFVASHYASPQSQEMPDDHTIGQLHVLVREARNLKATHSNGTSNPFCKSYLLPKKSKASKQKTAVVQKNCNPKWNHTFIFCDVTLSDLRERCLELTIWSQDKTARNNFLGGVRLSMGTGAHQGRTVDWMDSVGEEVNLWQAMLNKPNVVVESSLLLRSQMTR